MSREGLILARGVQAAKEVASCQRSCSVQWRQKFEVYSAATSTEAPASSSSASSTADAAPAAKRNDPLIEGTLRAATSAQQMQLPPLSRDLLPSLPQLLPLQLVACCSEEPLFGMVSAVDNLASHYNMNKIEIIRIR